MPEFADWCVIDYYAADGLDAVHSRYHDQRQENLVLEIRRRYRSERGENGDVLAALLSGEELLYHDMTKIASVRLSPEEAQLLPQLALRSSVVVPIHVEGRALGVVSFVSKTRPYDECDLAAAREFAAGCAQILLDLRARQELERTLALLDSLYADAPVGLALLDRDLRFKRINVKLAAMHGVSVEDHIGRTLTEVLGKMGDELTPLYRRVLDEQIAISQEFAAKPAGDPDVIHHWHISYVPVELDGEVLGVHAVVQDITERKRSEIRAAFLSRAGELLDTSLDYRRTLQSVARLAVPEIADWCSISMLNEHGEMRRLAVAHPDPAKDKLAQELIDRETLPPNAPAGAATAMQSATTQMIDEFTDELLVQSLSDPASHEIIRVLGIGSMISVPLIAREKTIGAISLIGERPGRFDREDVRLAEELARRVAVNIDNARLYTAHTSIARTLQAGLMPRALPHVPGLELAARYRPAGELIEVGGDFYDVYLRPNGEWLVVIGDVTGKGAEAAATTALVRYTLRAAAQHPGPPSRLLHELNSAMLAQRADYCTIGLVSVRPSPSGPCELSICLGGHPAPMLLAPGRDASPLGAPGMLLGFAAEADFPETHTSLAEGEIVLLYTDGLTDAAAPPGLTEAQLAERLRGCRTNDLDELLTSLQDAAIRDALGRPRDDIALLALRRQSA